MELAATLLLLSKVLAVAFAFECVRRLASSQQFNPLRIWRRTAMLTRQFPGPKPSSFLLGNLNEATLGPRRHRAVLDWANKFGGMYHLRFAWVNLMVISDPAIAAEVVHSRDFDKVEEAYRSVTKMMSADGYPDLVSGMTDSWWRLFRKGLAPAFSPASIRSGFKFTYAVCSELINVINNQLAKDPAQSIDMDQACLSETMDMIGQFAFGAQLNAIQRFSEGEVQELTNVMHSAEMEVERRLANPFREWTWWMTAAGRRETALFVEFQAIVKGLLTDMRRRWGTEPPEDDMSIGARMLRLRDPETGAALPDERLLPHIGMIFFAGHDTSGHTMAWTLYYIATHPEVEAKITAELASQNLLASPDHPAPRALEHDDLSELQYLGAAIKESMRLMPVVAVATIRVSHKDCTLGGGKYKIPAGTGLWTPLMALHNTTANWGADAGAYRPERWLEPGADYLPPAAGAGSTQQTNSGSTDAGHQGSGRGAASGSGAANGTDGSKARSYELNVSRTQDAAGGRPKRFIPFSDGRRDCVGQALAKMNYTAVLAMLLGRFHFELAPEMGGAEGVLNAEHMAMTLQPGGGLLMRVMRRELMAT